MPRAKEKSSGWLSWLLPRAARTAWSRSAPQQRAPRGRTDGFMAGYSDGLSAAKRDRLTEDWQPASLSPTSIHRVDSNLLLRRARDLVENNPYAKSAVEAYVANVVGCGITPKPLLADAGQRRQWVDAWNWWGGEHQNEADFTGQQHLYELMALWLTEVIVGGGCLVRYVALDPDQYRNQRVKLALELIPEERFADEKDDPTGFFGSLNRKKSGNVIRRGVELDPATGRPLAYWIRPAHPSDAGMAWEPIRVSAEDCVYSFFRTRVGQSRGFTTLKAVIRWLWSLGYYFDNELMASAMKSCFGVGVTTDAEDGDFEGLGGDDSSVVTDVNGDPLEKLEPGIFFRLKGKDSKITGVGPNTPGSDQEAWILLIERSIAVGAGLSYEAMTRDYSRGSFSSMRAGLNEDRKRYRPMQSFVVNHFCRPTYVRFVEAATQAGIDGFPRPSALVANFDDWMRVKWRKPGWQSVNPYDDARAAVLEINEGLGTREDYIAETKGGDWEEVDEQNAREAQSERDHKLNYGPPAQMDTAPSQQTAADTAGSSPTRQKGARRA
jgi:lambda family phage portal protein